MPEIINLPVISDDCSLAIIEKQHLPFEVKRLYFIYNIANDKPRGFHAHRETRQILFCLAGCVRLKTEHDGKREEIILKDPSIGVLLEPLMWHEMHDMDEHTILLVLASKEYDEADYIRDYSVFERLVYEE